jgi:hypothetical protein
VLPFGKRPLAFWQSVTPDYLRTFGVRLVRGRFFSEHDNESSAGATIVNETLARRFWPNQDPVGKQLIVARAELHEQVVGVVADVKTSALDADAGGELYSPYAQRPWPGHDNCREDFRKSAVLGRYRAKADRAGGRRASGYSHS